MFDKMGGRIAGGLVLTVVLIGMISTSAQAQISVARITSITGEVVIKRADEIKLGPAKVMMKLYDGDTLWTRGQSSVTMIFNTGRIQKVGAESEFTVQSTENQGSKEGVLSDLISGLNDLFEKETETQNELLGITGAIRERGSNPLLLMPINSTIADLTPTIVWKPMEGAISYKLTILGGPEVIVLEHVTSDTSVSLGKAGKKMSPGFNYSVTLNTTASDGKTYADQGYLYTAGEEELKPLQEAKEALEKEDVGLDETTKTIVFGRYLEKTNFRSQAYWMYKRFLEKHPDAEFASEGIERIEVEIGLRKQETS